VLLGNSLQGKGPEGEAHATRVKTIVNKLSHCVMKEMFKVIKSPHHIDNRSCSCHIMKGNSVGEWGVEEGKGVRKTRWGTLRPPSPATYIVEGNTMKKHYMR